MFNKDRFSRFLATSEMPEVNALDAAMSDWDENKHPRGGSKNKGQFRQKFENFSSVDELPIKWQDWGAHLISVTKGMLEEQNDMSLEEYEDYEGDGGIGPMENWDLALDEKTANELTDLLTEIDNDGEKIKDMPATNNKTSWRDWATHTLSVLNSILQERRDLTNKEYEEYEEDGDTPYVNLSAALTKQSNVDKVLRFFTELEDKGNKIFWNKKK